MGLGDPDLAVLAVQGMLGKGQEVRMGVDIQVSWHHRLVVHNGSMAVMVMVVHQGSGVVTGIVIVMGQLLMMVHSGGQRLQMMIKVMIQVVIQVMIIVVHNGGTVSQMDAIRMMDLGVHQVRQIRMVVAMVVIQMGQQTSLSHGHQGQDAHEGLGFIERI